MNFIKDTLNEARYFAKDVRAYLCEIERQRPLTREERTLLDKSHDVHIHTNDAVMIIHKN